MYELLFKVTNRTKVSNWKELSECARHIMLYSKIAHHLGLPYEWEVHHTDHHGNMNYVNRLKVFDSIVDG